MKKSENIQDQKKEKRKYIDYEKLFNDLFKSGRIVTVQELKQYTGYTSNPSIYLVITKLSRDYAIWSPEYGKYKLLQDEDFDKYK